MMKCLACCATLIAMTLALPGCGAGKLAGAMLQADEYQKKIEVNAKYSGLENKTIAVLVDADAATIYEHPTVVQNIAGGVSQRIARDVVGTRVLPSSAVINWQYRTPQWNSLPYGELAEQLNVDRVVMITLVEYRLNPPGNRYLWEGVCVGRVGIVERGGLDPDSFAQTFDVSAKYPNLAGVGRESATAEQIEFALLAEYIKKASWLFHLHEEPKYPDKYRPELDRPKKKKS